MISLDLAKKIKDAGLRWEPRAGDWYNTGWDIPNEEEYEFEDNVTDDEIEEEWKQWVWNEIGDRFGWRRVSEGGGE